MFDPTVGVWRAMRLAAAAAAVVAVAAAAPASTAAPAEPILGRWTFAGGVIDFVQRGPGRFANVVITQRPGVICPAVNDRDGQIVLAKRGARAYAGSWVWFDATTCRPAGKGALTITVAADGSTATMVANPPPGLESRPVTFRLTRSAARGSAQLVGAVGPAFTISLRGPRTLKAGRYTLVVDDQAQVHNFRLIGSGVNQAITTVPFVGRRTTTVVLRKGRYTFLCDPHASSLRGSFTVS